MKKPLYWSTLNMYEECPQRVLWSKGYPGIDLGGGEGKRKPGRKKKSEHHALMGIVIADVMEDLYNNEMWRYPKTLREDLANLVDAHFDSKVDRKHIDWHKPWVPSAEELRQTCLDGVLNYIDTMKHNRILGPYARAEVDLKTWLDKYNPVGGRADLIVRRNDSGVTIYDGKNSKSVGVYTDPDQLRWYGMCFYLVYRQMPDRLAFIYYRYPVGNPPEGHDGDWNGIVEVPFTKDDFKGLAERAREAGKGMFKGKWEANPSADNCKFCEYEHLCEERQAQIASRRRKKDDVSLGDGLISFGGDQTKSPAVSVSGGFTDEHE